MAPEVLVQEPSPLGPAPPLPPTPLGPAPPPPPTPLGPALPGPELLLLGLLRKLGARELELSLPLLNTSCISFS